MKKTDLFDFLEEHEIFTSEESTIVAGKVEMQALSIHWELRTLLYFGISLLSSGLGILIYQNIESIGHNVLIGLIALICISLFYFTFKNAKSFSWKLVENQEKFKDFALLGACISFLILGGYLQFQYNIFGERYGLATMIPAAVFFGLAYRFDHRGVLSMGITSLASSIGLSITPTRLLKDNDFLSQELVMSAIILGASLIFFSFFMEKRKMKAHFSFTYLFFGLNLAAIAALSGVFNFDLNVIYALIVIVLAIGSISYSRQSKSYIFMLLGVIYGYVAISYFFIQLMNKFESIFLYQFYFLASAGGVIFFLINLKKLVKGKS